jgi:DNA-binding FadR family transcriptional regulator
MSPGARIPAEQELALQLGVSRPPLREALIALEIDGQVDFVAARASMSARLQPAVAAPPRRWATARPS